MLRCPPSAHAKVGQHVPAIVGQREPAAIDEQQSPVVEPERGEHLVSGAPRVDHVVEQELVVRLVVPVHPQLGVARQVRRSIGGPAPS